MCAARASASRKFGRTGRALEAGRSQAPFATDLQATCVLRSDLEPADVLGRISAPSQAAPWSTSWLLTVIEGGAALIGAGGSLTIDERLTPSSST